MKLITAERPKVISAILADSELSLDPSHTISNPRLMQFFTFPIPPPGIQSSFTDRSFPMRIRFGFSPNQVALSHIESTKGTGSLVAVKYCLYSYIALLVHPELRQNKSAPVVLNLLATLACPPSQHSRIKFAFLDLLGTILPEGDESFLEHTFSDMCDFFLSHNDPPEVAFALIPRILRHCIRLSDFSPSSFAAQFCSLIDVLLARQVIPLRQCTRIYRLIDRKSVV
jgi:hypothetical protein